MTPLRRLWILYLPLALSTELMMVEGPIFHAAIDRLPDAVRSLRAWGLTIQLSMLIESPVIMLLTTSVALVQDRQALIALRRFVVWLGIAVTLLQGLVAWTPLLDLLGGRLLGYPAETVAAARVPMQILLLWSAAIGWRRFYQGVLVRAGQTRSMTAGTAFRLASLALSAALMVRLGTVSGAVAAAVAILIGVLAEALAITLLAAPVARRLPDGVQPLPPAHIWRFHAPLAATTLLSLIAGPLVSAALAQLPHRTETLAAWPVVFSALLVLRGWGFSLQEISVGQLRTGETPPEVLRRFAVRVGVASSLVTALIPVTPLLGLYARALALPEALLPLVRDGLLGCALLPLVTALGAWVRGALSAGGDTVAVYRAMVVGLLTLAVVLAVGVAAHVPAIPLAAFAVTASELAGFVYGLRAYSRSRRSSSAPEPSSASTSVQKT